MQAYEAYIEDGMVFPVDIAMLPKKKQRVIIVPFEKIDKSKKLTFEELFADWDGIPLEKDDEDKAWLEMKPVGREIF